MHKYVLPAALKYALNIHLKCEEMGSALSFAPASDEVSILLRKENLHNMILYLVSLGWQLFRTKTSSDFGI